MVLETMVLGHGIGSMVLGIIVFWAMVFWTIVFWAMVLGHGVGDHDVLVDGVWSMVFELGEGLGLWWGVHCGECMHRSWRILRPAAARQSVLSELEPRARTKHFASLLIDLFLVCVECGNVGEKQKARSGGLGCMV